MIVVEGYPGQTSVFSSTVFVTQDDRYTLEPPRLVDVGDGYLIRCVKYY